MKAATTAMTCVLLFPSEAAAGFGMDLVRCYFGFLSFFFGTLLVDAVPWRFVCSFPIPLFLTRSMHEDFVPAQFKSRATITAIVLRRSKPIQISLCVYLKPEDDEEAFNSLYCIAFAMMDAQGLVMRDSSFVAWEARKLLVIKEVEVAPSQKMEVRVKILFNSLCHTDVYFWEAKRIPMKFDEERGLLILQGDLLGQNPLLPGHTAPAVSEREKAENVEIAQQIGKMK
ncbi:hypothetical protein RHMOL_Rhmol09G0080200 [Rhododendron molle]|uniref:Uncharacterized protein n=1 Tax=Rhododendron molle TaxID=49168 RepID=A0ACC0MB12_RHOML|nr:hypothetical protein RHMOL_Rhmol09G0080200 [Rhododendron molle]